jgi:hypothetical protein
MWFNIKQFTINNDKFDESIMLNIQLTDARPQGQATSQPEAAEHIMGQMWNVCGNQSRINVNTYEIIKKKNALDECKPLHEGNARQARVRVSNTITYKMLESIESNVMSQNNAICQSCPLSTHNHVAAV